MMRIFLLLTLLVASFIYPKNALAAFSTPISLTPAEVGLFPSVDADSGGVIHVVWAQLYFDGSGNREIFYTKSTDNGVTFPEANKRNISNTSLVSSHPKLKVDTNNDIHIVWQEYLENGHAEIMYVQSSDDGVTFSTPANISNNSANSIFPNLETSGGNRVFVVWLDPVGTDEIYQVFLARSTDSGNSFGSGVNISNNLSTRTERPVIASRGGTVVVVWQSESFGNFGIWKVFSSDNGVNFNSAVNLSSSGTEYADRPSMAFDGAGRLHVVAQKWSDDFNQTDIDYYRSTDLGQTFEAAVKLTNTPAAIEAFPVVRTVGSNTVKVTYNAEVCNPTCAKATFEAESTNGGLGFGAAGSTEFTTPGVEDVDFDVIGTTLHMVYQQGNTVWYKKGSRS